MRWIPYPTARVLAHSFVWDGIFAIMATAALAQQLEAHWVYPLGMGMFGLYVTSCTYLRRNLTHRLAIGRIR